MNSWIAKETQTDLKSCDSYATFAYSLHAACWKPSRNSFFLSLFLPPLCCPNDMENRGKLVAIIMIYHPNNGLRGLSPKGNILKRKAIRKFWSLVRCRRCNTYAMGVQNCRRHVHVPADWMRTKWWPWAFSILSTLTSSKCNYAQCVCHVLCSRMKKITVFAPGYTESKKAKTNIMTINEHAKVLQNDGTPHYMTSIIHNLHWPW